MYSRTSALPCQVYVFWQSLSYARARAGTTPILWLNMDETAVQVCPRIGPGLVVKRRHWHQFAPRAANRKSARRAAVTYMGLVCSEDRVQPSLPQVIKANKHLFSRKLLQQLQSEDWDNVHMFENVHFWVESTAWQTAASFLRLLELVSQALQPWRGTYYPVFIIDCAPPHLGRDIMEACRRLQLHALYIPAGLSWLCQPLDLCGFSPFKAWLAREYRLLREAAEGGQVPLVAWARMLGRAGVDFWSARSWSHAFAAVGAYGEESQLAKAFREHMLQLERLSCLPAPPTELACSWIWPRNRRMEYAYSLLFRE